MAALLAVLGVACGGGGDGPTGGDGIASVSLNATSLSMLPGRTDQLVATARNDAGAPVVNAPAATWTTTVPAVATVTSTGLVTAVGIGSTDIRATIGSKTGTARVTVTDAPSLVTVSMPGLTFSPFKVTLKKDGRVNYEFPALAHNVIFERIPGAPADIPGQVVNQTISRTFGTVRLYRYSCTLHPGMDGEVDVVP